MGTASRSCAWPGLTCDTLVWIPQVQAFAAAHRTVIFDNRDAGQSSMADGDYEIADMARDALALADDLELDTFHLLGVSMGGAIAQEIALAGARAGAHAHARRHIPGGQRLRAPARPRSGAPGSAQISHEQHVDELMLLNHSEALLRATRDGRVHPHGDAEQPAPAAARGVRAPARRVRAATTRATGSAR